MCIFIGLGIAETSSFGGGKRRGRSEEWSRTDK